MNDTPAQLSSIFEELEFFNSLTFFRIHKPNTVLQEAGRRKKRKNLTKDGKLFLVAADHPARGVLSAGSSPIALADRKTFILRIATLLLYPFMDGVMGTADVMEELFLASHLFRDKTGKGFLDEKLLIGCMNRGGIEGTVFEMDDRLTAMSVEGLRRLNLDGGKLMFRLDEKDPASGKTLEYCAGALRELQKKNLSAFLEALAVKKTAKGYEVTKEAAHLARAVNIAQGLGDTTVNLWLKVPYCPDFHVVAGTTTCPVLLLGGHVTNPPALFSQVRKGMDAGENVRGLLIGRNVLFPEKYSTPAMAAALNGIVRSGISAKDALKQLKLSREKISP